MDGTYIYHHYTLVQADTQPSHYPHAVATDPRELFKYIEL